MHNQRAALNSPPSTTPRDFSTKARISRYLANKNPANFTYGPTKNYSVVTLVELGKIYKIGRTMSYELVNPKHTRHDPDFPVGFKAFPSCRAATVWWRHEIIAWLQKKENDYRHNLAPFDAATVSEADSPKGRNPTKRSLGSARVDRRSGP